MGHVKQRLSTPQREKAMQNATLRNNVEYICSQLRLVARTVVSISRLAHCITCAFIRAISLILLVDTGVDKFLVYFFDLNLHFLHRITKNHCMFFTMELKKRLGWRNMVFLLWLVALVSSASSKAVFAHFMVGMPES